MKKMVKFIDMCNLPKNNKYKDNKKYEYDEIFVVYLNPDHYDKPSDKSLTKDGKGEENILDVIKPYHLIVKSYSKDIYEWVKTIFTGISKNGQDSYLWSALHQYVDYLERIFYLGKYKDMEKELRDLIERHINTVSLEESRIDSLEELYQKIDSLRDEVKTLKEECVRKRNVEEWKNKAEEIAKVIGLDEKFKLEHPLEKFKEFTDSKALCVVLGEDQQKFGVVFGYDEDNKNRFYLAVYVDSDTKNKFPEAFIGGIQSYFVEDLKLTGECSKSKEVYRKWIEFAYINEKEDWQPKFKSLVEKCAELGSIS